MTKTNAMRILDRKKADYKSHSYDNSVVLDGMSIANMLGQDPSRVFKTLVTVGASKKNYVFMVPVCKELNLKKAAKAANEKKIEMIKSKELLPLTGYIHGGCSPIGMKKSFDTYIDKSAEDFEAIFFSGGRIGCQVEMSPCELKKFVDFTPADIAE